FNALVMKASRFAIGSVSDAASADCLGKRKASVKRMMTANVRTSVIFIFLHAEMQTQRRAVRSGGGQTLRCGKITTQPGAVRQTHAADDKWFATAAPICRYNGRMELYRVSSRQSLRM